jgi:hypothetical protein
MSRGPSGEPGVGAAGVMHSTGTHSAMRGIFSRINLYHLKRVRPPERKCSLLTTNRTGVG